MYYPLASGDSDAGAELGHRRKRLAEWSDST